MNKLRLLPAAAVVLGLAAIGWLAFLREPEPPPPAPPPKPPAPRRTAVDPVPAKTPAKDLVWCRRIGGEVLALVRKAGGQADAGATLSFFDPGDGASGSLSGPSLDERTDSSGVFRGRVPDAFTRVHLLPPGADGERPDPVPIPPGPPSNGSILCDRAELRPGGRFRLCVRVEKPPEPGAAFVGLRFEGLPGVDPGGPLPGEVEEEPNPAGPDPFPCWRVLDGTVPDVAPVGSAVVACGAEERRIPVVARFGRGSGMGRGDSPDIGGGMHDGPPPGDPDTPPIPPEPAGGAGGPGSPPPAASPPAAALALEGRDGEWRARGPFDTAAVLFFVEAGGLLLVHQGAIAVDGEAATALPLGDHPPSGATVTAVASTPRGFLEASAPVPGADGEPPLPSDSDAVLADFLAEARKAPPPPEEPAAGPALESRGAAIRPGVPEVLFRAGEAPDPETVVRWETDPPGAAGALRIRCGPSILLEARVGGEGDGDSGTLRAGDMGVRPVLVESGAKELRAVAFSWSAPPASGESPARPGRVVTLERVLPAGGRRGEEVECRLVLGVREPCLCAVTCPVPGGAVPAEDGWSIRARAPAGTRVGVKAGAVSFLVPMGMPGEAVLTFRIRLGSPGRSPAPAASVACSAPSRHGPPFDRAYSASAVLAVE